MKSNLERIITFKLAAASWFLSGGDLYYLCTCCQSMFHRVVCVCVVLSLPYLHFHYVERGGSNSIGGWGFVDLFLGISTWSKVIEDGILVVSNNRFSFIM